MSLDSIPSNRIERERVIVKTKVVKKSKNYLKDSSIKNPTGILFSLFPLTSLYIYIFAIVYVTIAG
jgi:hypothetical protein